MSNFKGSSPVWFLISAILFTTVACGPSTAPANAPAGDADTDASETATPSGPGSGTSAPLGEEVTVDDLTITVSGYETSLSGGGVGGDTGITSWEWLDLYLMVKMSITCNKPAGETCVLFDYLFTPIDSAANTAIVTSPVFPPGVMENLDEPGPFFDYLSGEIPGGTTSEGLLPIQVSDHGIDLSSFDPKTFDFDGYWNEYTDGFKLQVSNLNTGSEVLFSVK